MSTLAYPHDLAAERSVLGAVLLEDGCYDDAASVLHSAHFYRQAHRQVWDAMTRLREAGTPIDVGTVRAALGTHGLEDVGGLGALASLTDGVPRTTNVVYYAKTVRDKATLRALMQQASALLERASTTTDDAEEVVADAERALLGLSQGAQTGEWQLAADWFADMARRVERVIGSPNAVNGIPTGLPKLDAMTRGLQRGDLVVVGARPSVGKTSLMWQWARLAASIGTTGVFSLEMSASAIGYRALSQEAQIPAFRLMSGFVSAFEQRAVMAALDTLAGLPLAVDDSPGMTPARICAKARRLKARYGASALFIDYLQLLYSGAGRTQNRTQELGEIAKTLKDLAKELDCPIVVLSQLTREADKGGEPKLWHLRESGDIEAAADVVLLLHRPGQHADGQGYADNEEARIYVAKQRNGPTGMVTAQWHAQTMRFVERDERAA